MGGEIVIFEKVRDIISDQLGIDADEISMESSFIDDLGADSLDIVELIMALESEFDMEIPDEDAEKISVVSDVVDYIKSHIEE
ncbi:acyl carrier protein [Clostridiales bacterium oral taxon 876 str. F0540]|nr:acyl carrier protein [Clostridiales bacterium oral taxon 876 str. F0540]